MTHSTLTPSLNDLAALSVFLGKYPTWWWRIGVCDYSRDFTAGPQQRSPENRWSQIGNVWDGGFSSDHHGSIADAVFEVLDQIEKAKITAVVAEISANKPKRKSP